MLRKRYDLENILYVIIFVDIEDLGNRVDAVIISNIRKEINRLKSEIKGDIFKGNIQREEIEGMLESKVSLSFTLHNQNYYNLA